MHEFDDDAVMLAGALSSGALPAPYALLVQARAAFDALDSDIAQVGDVVGGVLLETSAPVAVGPDALSNALAVLDDIEPEAANPIAAAQAAGRSVQEILDLPEPVRSAAFEAVERGGWRFCGVGVRSMELCREGDAKAELFRIEPGVGVPPHGHSGKEATLVLSGAFVSEGRTFRRGDLCVVDSDTVHGPSAGPDAVCIALAVTDGAIRFQGLLGLIQKALLRH